MTKTAARTAFEESMEDIQSLFDFHSKLGGRGPGKKDPSLDVLSRSAFVLITAFWEAYCEDVVIEEVKRLASELPNPDNLPNEIRRHLARTITADKHEHAPWRLAGENWRTALRDDVEKVVRSDDRRLGGPGSKPTIKFFQEMLGINDISVAWK